MKRYLRLLLFSVFSVSSLASTIPNHMRTDIAQFINHMVDKHRFDQRELEVIFDKTVLDPQVIQYIQRPAEAKPWDDYQKIFLTNQRIKEGLKFWDEHADLLTKAEKQYGVPADIIVAILGVETFYGERQGGFRVIDALSTLAFNYPKRAKFFKQELEQYLLLTREHKHDPFYLKGSYAGAIGTPQFMPSSYRAYAVDSQNKGQADLLANPNDVINSVANYFKHHGWQANQPVVTCANIQGNEFKHLKLTNRKAKYTLTQLAEHGVKPQDSNPAKKAGLVALPTKKKAPEYFVAYPNFYVITRYNTSNLYAMAVYQLAEEIKAQRVAQIASREEGKQAYA